MQGLIPLAETGGKEGQVRDLAAFEGEWVLDRVIEDARAGVTGRLTGCAAFALDRNGLRYTETGALELPGQPPMTATRRYLWRTGDRGIGVHFEDGRFFHLIGSGDCPEARHDCAPDLYLVRYDFRHWPRWSACWTVRGPRKDYVMRSTYLPSVRGACAAGGAGAEELSTRMTGD